LVELILIFEMVYCIITHKSVVYWVNNET
jgi:hypothetical protein